MGEAMDKKTFAAAYFGMSYLIALYALSSMKQFGLVAAIVTGPAVIVALFRLGMKFHGEA